MKEFIDKELTYNDLLVDRILYYFKAKKLAKKHNVSIKVEKDRVLLYTKISDNDKVRIFKLYKDIYLLLSSIDYFESKESFVNNFLKEI